MMKIWKVRIRDMIGLPALNPIRVQMTPRGRKVKKAVLMGEHQV